MLELKLRDVTEKNRKFRNAGFATGTLKRLNGDIIPISTSINKLDKYLMNSNNCHYVKVSFEGEIIDTVITDSQKHLTLHNTINIDFKELQ